MIKQIGTVNGRFNTRARVGNKEFEFDGTTKGLTIAALNAGVKVGEVMETDIGRMRLIAAPHDDRAQGYWCEQVWN